MSVKSGSIETTTGYTFEGVNRKVKLIWEISSQNKQNNSTTISWRLVGSGDAKTKRVLIHQISVKINGSEIYSNPGDGKHGITSQYGERFVGPETYTIYHKGDGSCTFTISLDAGIYNWQSNCYSGDHSFTLPTIVKEDSSKMKPPINPHFNVSSLTENDGKVVSLLWTNPTGISGGIGSFTVELEGTRGHNSLSWTNSQNEEMDFYWSNFSKAGYIGGDTASVKIQTKSSGSHPASNWVYVSLRLQKADSGGDVPIPTLKAPILYDVYTSGNITGDGGWVTITDIYYNEAEAGDVTIYYSTNGASYSAFSYGNDFWVSSNSPTIYVYIEGKGGRSGTLSKTITTIAEPEIVSISCNASEILARSFTNKKLVKRINLSCTCINTQNYTWQIKSKNNLWKTISYSKTVTDFDASSYCNEGQNIQIRLYVNGDTFYSKTYVSDLYILPKLQKPTNFKCFRVEEKVNGTVSSSYFNKKMKFSVMCPAINTDYGAPLKALSIYNSSDTLIKQLSFVNGQIISEEAEINMDYGTTTSFYVKAVDQAGQIENSDSSSTFTRLQVYDSTGSLNSSTKGEDFIWKVNTNDKNADNNQLFQYDDFFPISHKNETQGKLTYEVNVSLDGGHTYQNLITFYGANNDIPLSRKPIKGETSVNIDNSKSTISFAFQGDNYYLFKLLNLKWDNDYPKVKFKTCIKNAFGQIGKEVVYNGAIMTTSAPYFKDNNTITLGRGYAKNEEKSEIFIEKFPLALNQIETINPKEILRIKLDSLALDKNDHEDYNEGKTTIKFYQIKCKVASSNSWMNLTTVSQYKLDGEKPYWDILLPNSEVFEGKDVFFGISAIDTSHKESEIKESTLKCHYGRRQKPFVTVTNSTLDINKNLNMTFSIDDLGGDEENCFNFLREPQKTEKAELIINYSNNPDSFSPDNEIVNTKNLIELQSAKEEGQTIKFSFKIKQDFQIGSTLYIKIILKISTNNKYQTDFNKIISDIPVYTYYQESPTVSCRKHWLGLNTKDYNPQDKEILQIKPSAIGDKINLYCSGTSGIISINLIQNSININQIFSKDIKNANGLSTKDLTCTNLATIETLSGKNATFISVKTDNILADSMEGCVIDCGTW